MAKSPKTKRAVRQFDYDKYAKRPIALFVSYTGWDYDGLVTQVGQIF